MKNIVLSEHTLSSWTAVKVLYLILFDLYWAEYGRNIRILIQHDCLDFGYILLKNILLNTQVSQIW